MKKTTALLFIVFLTGFSSFAQQGQTYYRIKIKTGKNGLVQLAKKGVAVDHGEYKKGMYFMGDFSDHEMDLIKQTGLPYQVLISDLSSYYANRNTASAKTMQVAGACNNCPNYQTPANFTLGSMGGFYTYQELLNILDSMITKYPNLISTQQVIDTGHTWEGRQIYYVRISNNPNVNQSKPQLLYTALHHAREPESLSQLIFYMWYLLENYNANAEIKYLIDNLEMYFVPCVNPDGYIYNHTIQPAGGGLWRKNRRNNNDGTYGVDLNRNYGYEWGADDIGSSPNTSDDTYRGPSAFSEPETQMMEHFCNKHTFSMAINNHTYDNVLVQPNSPDSLLYDAFSARMTFCDDFGYGDDMETVGYTTNGNSDQWMYGDTSLKPKIFAMTPEAGSVDDGFYPVKSNIIPIAAYTMDQNIHAARLTSAYAYVTETNGPFITQSGYIAYNIQRLGLQAATFSVSVTPVGSAFQTVGTGKTYTGMAILQNNTDSINYTLVNSLTAGTVVKFLLNVSNGSYTISDTVTRVYGIPVVAFSDNCNTTSAWTGTWGISTQSFVSPTGSITDSPVGDYPTDANTTITTTQTIDLTDAIAAYLQFSALWQLEKNYDYTEVQVTTDGNSFMPLCGKYTHNGDQYQDQGNPLYDGFQKTWIRETINLSAYLGQKIQLRFNLVSDDAVVYDGFYFDDISVKKLVSIANGINQINAINNQVSIYPNPNNGRFVLLFNASSSEKATITVSNILGELIYSTQQNSIEKGSQEIRLNNVANGTYFVHIQSTDLNYVQKIIVNR